MTVFLAFLAGAVGLVVGSFLNVCIHRWPLEESVVQPRSHCPACNKQIAWFDNIPLLSYFLLRGRCRDCRAPISFHYPLVELLNGLLYLYIFSRFGLDASSAKAALFSSMMLVLIFTDLREFILPDEITLGGLVIGLAASPFLYLEQGVTEIFWIIARDRPEPWAVSLVESAFSAAFLFGLLFTVREAYYRVRKVDGLGLGDVKMMAMVGAFWGLGPSIYILLAASLLGAAVGTLIVLIGRKRWTHELPFGSYLGAASLIVAVWGDDIWNWYVAARS